MEPNQDKPQANFDFIMNQGAVAPKNSSAGGASGKTKRIIIAAAGGLFILFALMIGFAVISSGGQAYKTSLITVAAEQQELLRIANAANTYAREASVRNYALVTKFNLTTDQQNLNAQLKKVGVKPTPAQLASKKSQKTDQVLLAAISNNTYDTVYEQVMKEQLAIYRKDIKSAYEQTPNKTVKAVLSANFDNAGTLLNTKE